MGINGREHVGIIGTMLSVVGMDYRRVWSVSPLSVLIDVATSIQCHT